MIESSDGYKKGCIVNPGVDSAQWYFGSRKRDFYLYGIEGLKNSLKDLPIKIENVPEGSLVKKGNPAVTFTITGNQNIHLGFIIENLVYHSLWYKSTIFTYLMEFKNHMIDCGFDPYSVIGKIRRGCSCFEQAKMAEDVFSNVFYPIPESISGVSDHASILINGEDFCFQNSHCVMIDTFDKEIALKKLDSQVIMIDSGDLYTEVVNLLSTTDNILCLISTIDSKEEWKTLVEKISFLPNKNRVLFSIGSEVFQKVCRDDLDLIYKPNARKINNVWEGVSKKTVGKETLSGLLTIKR